MASGPLTLRKKCIISNFYISDPNLNLNLNPNPNPNPNHVIGWWSKTSTNDFYTPLWYEPHTRQYLRYFLSDSIALLVSEMRDKYSPVRDS